MTRSRVRGVTVLVGLVSLLTLASCGSDPGTTTSSATDASGPSATSSATKVGATMRDEIAQNLEGPSPSIAAAVRDESTTITEVPATALGAWQIVDVSSDTVPHGRRWFMAVRGDGTEVVVLSGFPERWSRVLEGASVGIADEAVQLAQAYSDAVRDMTQTYRRVESVDDIPFTPSAEEDVIDRLRTTLRVGPPEVKGDGPWTVVLWTVVESDLVRHELSVDRDGAIEDDESVAESGLPVGTSA